MPLKTKLIILFIAFTVVPLVLFGAVAFFRAGQILETIRIAQLNNIADLKKDKIEIFFNERRRNFISSRQRQSVREYLPVISKYRSDHGHPAYLRAKRELDAVMKPVLESYGYLDVMLVDRNGVIVYAGKDASADEKLGKTLWDGKTLAEGSKDVYFGDVYLDKDVDYRFEMLGAAPILDREGNFAGEIVMEMDMGPIYKFIRETTGLGVTGEALIDRREGNSIVFLSPINDDPDAALKKKVTFNDKAAYAAQKAALGETGSGVATDYRGVEVLAAWRYIPSLRWGLVTKINAAEAFAPVRQLRTIILSLGLFVTLAGIAAAVTIARTVTRPIRTLQRGAEAVAAGDLGHRVGTAARDEIGRLSRSFDAMTEALSRDIARREKAESEIRSLNDDLQHHVLQLEESNRELEAFSYSVSHDLRSPLRSIDGFSLALIEDYADRLDDEGKEYLSRVRGATQRMGQLIDDLLKLSRLARMEMKREQLDLSALAADIASRLRQNHPEREAEFIIAGGLTAQGDERLLTAALENLFGNAWKFSEKTPRSVIEFGVTKMRSAECGMRNEESKTVEPKSEIASAECEVNSAFRIPNSELVFFVRDNGAGFDMAYANKLFNPFQRLHHAAEFSGTGIGLATVKRIINRHGGRVWIEGAVGQGTTVYFTL